MLTLENYQNIIKNKIEEDTFNDQPIELYEPINYTLKLGGKRLRPTLTLLACDIFDGEIDQALNAALGLETFHNFTLLHDDIMDKAPIRRGFPTVYKKWDANRAILSGDTMMVLAYDYLLNSPKDLLYDLFKVFNKVGKEVCEGQQFDMNFETADCVSIDDYLRMIKLKTAVLIGGSLQVGAIIARASQEQASLIYNFGENIGMAFQLQDDLLDAFGDSSIFGKQTGGDIRTNKKTYLYLKALAVSNETDRKRLKELYSLTDENNQAKVDEVLEIFNRYQISQLIKDLMEDYYKQAMIYLKKIDLSKVKEDRLISIADTLMKRDS
ncbi:MAG: polyprenyl synthetase family protein [Bacteroidales bacterium]|nr:polyprenyl synthetase family protein [Bacteroidales bacterium]